MNSRRVGAAGRRVKNSNVKPCTSQAKPASSVRSRLCIELSEIMSSTNKSVTAFPDEENTFRWHGKIQGPPDSVYSELAYKLNLTFPENYPYKPPTITFVTPCFHPNVDTKGNICLDVLKDMWSSCNNTLSVLLSIQSLLQDPNIDSPLNTQAANLWNSPQDYKCALMAASTEAIEVFKSW